MNQLIHQSNDRLFVTSLEIAEHFGKEHRNILQAIGMLQCSPEFAALNFQRSEYKAADGSLRPMHTITRDGFVFLCMGFTGAVAAQWKERYINAFNEMEAALRKSQVHPQQLALAREVGGLKDEVARLSQLDASNMQVIVNLQAREVTMQRVLIASQAHELKLTGKLARSQAWQNNRNQTLLVEMLSLEGKTNTQIAHAMGLTYVSVKMRVRHLRKIGRLPAPQQNLSLH
jgi:Rha family phage regulatory protein